MKNIKLCFFILFLYLIYIILSAQSYSLAMSKELSDNVLRLHIIANSNSIEDQYLKLKIRDNILSYFSSVLDTNNSKYSKEELLYVIKSHEKEISNIVYQTIEKEGFDYEYSIKYENIPFQTKTYGNFILPSGNYDSVNITIGKHLRRKLVVYNVS